MTAQLLPGQPFQIEAAGQTFDVVALSGKQQEELAEQFAATAEAEGAGRVVEMYRITKRMLDTIFGQAKSDELWSTTVDAQCGIEIVRAVLSKTQLDEGEAKN